MIFYKMIDHRLNYSYSAYNFSSLYKEAFSFKSYIILDQSRAVPFLVGEFIFLPRMDL